MIVTRVRIGHESERMTKVTVFNEAVVKTKVVDEESIELISADTFTFSCKDRCDEYYKVELDASEIEELIRKYDDK